MPKKILVSGGLGFVGYHLVDRLLREGHSVTIVDNLSSNVLPKNFFDKEFKGQCEVVIKDIKDVMNKEDYKGKAWTSDVLYCVQKLNKKEFNYVVRSIVKRSAGCCGYL